MRILGLAIDLFFRGVMVLCKLLLIVQVIACAIVFFGRYVVGRTPSWADPVAIICMVWLCILSSSLAVRNDSHLRITVMDSFLSRGQLFILNVLSAEIVLAVAIFLVYAGGQLTQLSARSRIPGLGIPSSWLAAVLPITGVAYLAALVDRWRIRNER